MANNFEVLLVQWDEALAVDPVPQVPPRVYSNKRTPAPRKCEAAVTYESIRDLLRGKGIAL